MSALVERSIYEQRAKIKINSIWDNDSPHESCFRIALDGRRVVSPEDSS